MSLAMQNEMDMHELPQMPEEPARRSLWGPLYIIAWLVLASGAIAYLAALAFSPEAVRISFTSGPGAAGEAAGDLRSQVAEARIEGAEVARGLESLKAEVAAIKADLAEIAASRMQDGAALAPEEGGEATRQADATAMPLPARKSTEAAAEDAQETGAIGTETVASLSGGEDELSAAVERAAAADEQPAWGSDVAAQTDKGSVKAKVFGLEIAQATSPEALHVSWEAMAQRHQDLLGGLSAVARAPVEGEDGYRLVAGPFRSAQSAKSTCSKLSAAGVSCSLTAFEGEAF